MSDIVRANLLWCTRRLLPERCGRSSPPAACGALVFGYALKRARGQKCPEVPADVIGAAVKIFRIPTGDEFEDYGPSGADQGKPVQRHVEREI